MPLGFSIDNNPEDRKWFGGFGAGDVTSSGGGFRAQAEDDEKKKLAFIDFNAAGNGDPAGYRNASVFTQQS